MSIATIKENWSILVTVASLAFGAGGYAASSKLSVQQQVQQTQINELTRIVDKVVTIQEGESSSQAAVMEWIRLHDSVKEVNTTKADALKAAKRGQ